MKIYTSEEGVWPARAMRWFPYKLRFSDIVSANPEFATNDLNIADAVTTAALNATATWVWNLMSVTNQVLGSTVVRLGLQAGTGDISVYKFANLSDNVGTLITTVPSVTVSANRSVVEIPTPATDWFVGEYIGVRHLGFGAQFEAVATSSSALGKAAQSQNPPLSFFGTGKDYLVQAISSTLNGTVNLSIPKGAICHGCKVIPEVMLNVNPLTVSVGTASNSQGVLTNYSVGNLAPGDEEFKVSVCLEPTTDEVGGSQFIADFNTTASLSALSQGELTIWLLLSAAI